MGSTPAFPMLDKDTAQVAVADRMIYASVIIYITDQRAVMMCCLDGNCGSVRN